MAELVSRSQADLILGWIVPALACLVGAALWKPRRLWSVLAVAGGALAAVLWRVFNAILDRTGPDSIAGLALCAGLFLVAGVALGFVPRRPV